MHVSRETLDEVRAGIKDTWLVGLGLIPLGLAFGLLMTQAGYAWWWTPIFSTVIYAKSLEFLAINMVAAGIGPLSAAVTGFMVNFRHIFYGLTYPRHLIRSWWGRRYSAYALTDETYAIVSARGPNAPVSGPRLLTIQVVCQLLWVIPGIVGALAGQIIPPDVKGMEFALNALFIVLVYEALQSSRDLGAVVLAMGMGILAMVLVPSSMLMVALIAYFLLLLVRYWAPALDKKLTWRMR